MLAIPQLATRSILRPLDRVALSGAKGGTVVVRDGAGREYVRAKAAASVPFTVAGALGTHVAALLDTKGREREALRFRVDAETAIADRKGEFSRLLTMLRYTMIHWHETGNHLVDGRIYSFFVCWLRDHVHTLKGMKYFHPELRSAIELYRDTQRDDGMIWDNIYARHPGATVWDQRFEYGGFIRQLPEKTLEMKRIPVENDVEYLYLEGIYWTWKATGDTGWMRSHLPSALKAVAYSLKDAYRWSTSEQLLKRGFTIDTWDYQTAEDAALVGGDMMAVKPGATRFGIFHGDNTGMHAALGYLAEMLDAAGRPKDAEKHRRIAQGIKQRLDALAWNGRFYRHHLPEDRAVVRELGVDTEAQVSMSNAYALNRGVTQEQAEAIIGEYQRIKASLPKGSNGEWYAIHPWFTKGFKDQQGQYMNGGVNVITAGELAHGAFERGFEAYGVDILRRVAALAERHDGYLHCCFAGWHPPKPERAFTPLDLAAVANADTAATGAPGVPGWTNEGPNDLHEMPSGDLEFEAVPYRVIDPAANGRRAVMALSSKDGYARRLEVPVGRAARSLYLLHTVSGGSGLAGVLRIIYADGTSHARYVRRDQEVLTWWMPEKKKGAARIAWEGANATCRRVGVCQWAFEHPHPGKPIARLVFEAAEDGAQWMVLGVTLCDGPAWFAPSDVSYGIPDNWGAGAVTYALVEGLAGVVDRGLAFDRAEIAPRWPGARVDEAEVCIRYAASAGYVAYHYRHIAAKRRIEATVTGSGDTATCRFLLPAKAKRVASVTVDGDRVPATEERVRGSRYARFEVALGAARKVVVGYA